MAGSFLRDKAKDAHQFIQAFWSIMRTRTCFNDVMLDNLRLINSIKLVQRAHNMVGYISAETREGKIVK